MAAVHFTTIPCETNTANRHEESHVFREIHSTVGKFIVYGRGGVVRTFLRDFMGTSEF